MLFDRMLSFFENASIAKTKSAATNSRILDTRLNGEVVTHDLNVLITAVGTPPMVDSSTVAVVSTKLQTSASGTGDWSDLGSAQASVGNTLYAGKIPYGCKRFVRAVITNPKGAGDSGTDLAAAYTVKGGVVVGEIEYTNNPDLQAFRGDLASGEIKGEDGKPLVH